ncbi:hypothetical protein BR93DRAFT_574064 [Coniochaeta sp. PMI_546]|nr:hypothetical protein BR93DRAFT_574064 [Coniochaeta sp. PMI_546]
MMIPILKLLLRSFAPCACCDVSVSNSRFPGRQIKGYHYKQMPRIIRERPLSLIQPTLPFVTEANDNAFPLSASSPHYLLIREEDLVAQ